MVQFFGPLGK